MDTHRDTNRRRARRGVVDREASGADAEVEVDVAEAELSRADVAYHAIKGRLLQGEFPLLARLGEERLAQEIGVSRTPVREALKRLHIEELLERHPDGGYRPVVPDVTVMRHLYEVRAGLELLALERPGRLGVKHDPTVLEPLRDRWARLASGALPAPDPSFVLMDESFHVTLASAAGNGVLVEQLEHVNQRIRVVRMFDFLSAERIEATIAEHLDIVNQVLAGDVERAAGAFRAHLAGSVNVVEQRVQAAIARMVTGGGGE
jgi:DNA-binding GntR family transcriptional regulator